MAAFLRFKKICLKLIYKNACIRWGKFRANSTSRNLIEYFLPKLKVVMSENIFMSMSVGTFLFCLQSSASLRPLRPALCGMLGYKPTTSAVTKIES